MYCKIDCKNELATDILFKLVLFSNQDIAFPQLSNSTRLRRAYSAVLTVTMASDQSFYEAFRSAQQSQEIRQTVAATEVPTPVHSDTHVH